MESTAAGSIKLNLKGINIFSERKTISYLEGIIIEINGVRRAGAEESATFNQQIKWFPIRTDTTHVG